MSETQGQPGPGRVEAFSDGVLGPVLYTLSALLAFVFTPASWALFIVIPLIYILWRPSRPPTTPSMNQSNRQG